MLSDTLQDCFSVSNSTEIEELQEAQRLCALGMEVYFLTRQHVQEYVISSTLNNGLRGKSDVRNFFFYCLTTFSGLLIKCLIE